MWYTKRILERFGVREHDRTHTPTQSRQVQVRKFERMAKSRKLFERPKVPYRGAVGSSFLYLAGGTRHYFFDGVNILSRSPVQPTQENWQDVLWIPHYLNGTIHLGLRCTQQEL